MFSNKASTGVFNIMVDDNIITQSHCEKFLGVHMDDKLQWSNQVDACCKKLSKIIYCLRIMSKYCDYQILITMYRSLIESVLAYCVNIWGHSSENNMLRLFRVQKQAVRLIANIKGSDTCKPYFITYNILTVPSLYIFKTILHLINNENIPQNKHIHKYNTRTKMDYHIDQNRLTSTQKGTQYAGIKLYNHLPITIKESKTFNKDLNKYLIVNCFYSVEEYYAHHNSLKR